LSKGGPCARSSGDGVEVEEDSPAVRDIEQADSVKAKRELELDKIHIENQAQGACIAEELLYLRRHGPGSQVRVFSP
jgi:hypothetical protein